MVRHGRTKKRRAGRIGRTKLKHKGGFKRWDPKPKVADAAVKTLWDAQKTPQQNLTAMGLRGMPNANATNTATNRSITDDNTTNKKNVIALYDIPESDDLHGRTKSNKHPPLNEAEQRYIVKCMAKHGTTNFRKMFRDLQVNKLQHTQEKLQKMGARFLLLTPQQVHIPWEEIPASIRSQMQMQSQRPQKEREETEDET